MLVYPQKTLSGDPLLGKFSNARIQALMGNLSWRC